MKGNANSWFPMSVYDKTSAKGIFFGPALQPEKSSYMYPNEKIKNGECVIWIPDSHCTISLKSYEKAHRDEDIEALSKISKMGVNLGCTFGGLLKLKNGDSFRAT